MTQEDNKPAGTWRVEYRNDGNGPMRFADGSIVCLIKDGPHSVVAYDVAEPDARRIVTDHAKAMLADRIAKVLDGMPKMDDGTSWLSADEDAWLAEYQALTEAEGMHE